MNPKAPPEFCVVIYIPLTIISDEKARSRIIGIKRDCIKQYIKQSGVFWGKTTYNYLQTPVVFLSDLIFVWGGD